MTFGYYKVFVMVSIAVMASPIFSAVDVFTPDRGRIIPDTWEVGQMGGVFQNPVQLMAGPHRATLRVDTAQDRFGYSQWSLGLKATVLGSVVGLGYLNYGSQDLVSTTRNNQTQRIQESGTFGDTIHSWALGVASGIGDNFEVGGNIDYTIKTIDRSQASQIAVGAGFRYSVTNEFAVVGYSRRLLQTPFRWGGVSETPSSGMSFGGEFRTAYTTILGYISDRGVRVNGELPIVPELSLTAGYAGGNTERYSLGTILKLSAYAIQYIHTGYTDSTLGLSQDMVGVAININDFTQ